MPPNLHHPDHWSPQTLNLAEHDADVLVPVLAELEDQGVLGAPEVKGVLWVVEASLLDLVAIQAHQEVFLAIPVDYEVEVAMPDLLQQQS